jgi:hypothetical protein
MERAKRSVPSAHPHLHRVGSYELGASFCNKRTETLKNALVLNHINSATIARFRRILCNFFWGVEPRENPWIRPALSTRRIKRSTYDARLLAVILQQMAIALIPPHVEQIVGHGVFHAAVGFVGVGAVGESRDAEFAMSPTCVVFASRKVVVKGFAQISLNNKSCSLMLSGSVCGTKNRSLCPSQERTRQWTHSESRTDRDARTLYPQ